MNKQMYAQMNKTELNHWWFKAKREIILSLAWPYLKAGGKQLADFGCGCGTLLKKLEAYGNVIGYDFSPTALDYCKSKFDGELAILDLNNKDAGVHPDMDVAFALDIVEHVENDSIAIENIYRALKGGGMPYLQYRHFNGFGLKTMLIILIIAGTISENFVVC